MAKVLIVGGGISGLAAECWLQKTASKWKSMKKTPNRRTVRRVDPAWVSPGHRAPLAVRRRSRRRDAPPLAGCRRFGEEMGPGEARCLAFSLGAGQTTLPRLAVR